MLSAVLVVLCFVSFEGVVGGACYKDGVAGTCVPLQQCASAVEDSKRGRIPQMCSFNMLPIVCCLNVTQDVGTSAQTDEGKVSTVEPTNSLCPPIPAELTAPRTGQKAWDKCLEYQQLVYPCTESPITGEPIRDLSCSRNHLTLSGTQAVPEDFPHYVLLGHEELKQVKWACSGSLISDKFILTAGFCTASREKNITHVALKTLKRSEVDPKNVYKVKSTLRHPKYKPPKRANDIALVELETPVQLDGTLVPGCLITGELVDSVNVPTWGIGTQQDYTEQKNKPLQKATLTKISSEECVQAFPATRLFEFNETIQMCYSPQPNSPDTCAGDSGSGLVVSSKKIACMVSVVGITSFRTSCRENKPSVYTRLEHYVPWVESVVWP